MPGRRGKSKRKLSRGGGTGICSYCDRVHPKGKNAKSKARKKGWRSCAEVSIEKNKRNKR